MHGEGGVSCMVWAAVLSGGRGHTSPCIMLVRAHHPHWQVISSGNATYNMEKYTECKPHKTGFENVRVFFLILHAGLLLWTFCVFVLCSFYTAQLHTFWSAGQSVQLLPLFLCSQFEVWLFWGGWRSAVPLSARACAACSSWDAHGTDMAHSLSPAWSDAHAPTPSKGES